MASKFAKMTQTIVFIIFAVLASIILLSYFNINMTSNEPSKLNRFAIFEGHENQAIKEKYINKDGKKQDDKKKDGFANENKANLLIQ